MSTELVSRQHTPSSAPVAMQQQTDALMTRAKMIASAPKDMLPQPYRNNPGACLLAVDWAERNDVSIFEALGEVSFVHGRPVVSAVMQKRLAARHGYRTVEISGDATHSIVAVIDGNGEEVGRFTYTIDMANALGINKGPVWKADPAQMLYKRATTRALERYGPAELAPVMVEHEAADTAAEVETATVPPAPPPPAAHPDDVVDLPAVETPTAAELRDAAKAKGVRAATVMRTVQEMHPDAGLATFDDIAEHRDAALDLADWIDQQ